jgi:serine/threonine protein kinase
MKKLGKFEILEQIGKGAMGVVYKARDPFIGRLVALKTITTGLADDPVLLERFYQEARSAGALEHPNIVTIFELGKEVDTPFIAMAFLEGGSLDKLIEARPVLPLSQKLSYIVYACRALEYAHKRGVIHRDIKPGNVMVTADGAVKVVDFGIARFGDTGRTQTGTLIGTLGYMSPQLIGGKTADARSDIWAVGVMFYELLAYQRPFNGENHVALMMNIHSQPTPSILEAAPGTPPDVVEIVERMLRKDVDERFQSMEEVLIELEPVWKRVQQLEVSALVADGKRLFEAGDLTRAQEVLHNAILLDTANTQAKNLVEKINADIRRREIVPQVKARVEKGENLLAVGQFEEAKAEADAALQLDSTYLPARELLAQVQKAAERVRMLAQGLRATKQRLAEGSITEAELQLTKVLEIDDANVVAQDLLKQIREEKSRREYQKRLSETLHCARAFWTELRYDECIQFLLEAQQEFPGEGEIDKVLETARQDKAEQERQTLLTQARRFLRTQQFDEALKVLERVLAASPGDSTGKNLRMLAIQGREQQIRELQFREDLANLRALVKNGKFQEAIAGGEELLREFPREFELEELVAYARSEYFQREQKRNLEQCIEMANQEIKSGHFQEAILTANSGLDQFPRDPDLVRLVERAKKQQKEKEKREILEQRIKEVKTKINREDLTGAIDLARQTLVSCGPDTDITQLLHQAEVEVDHREKKKVDQQETLLAARTQIDSGNFGDATLILQDAVATRLISDSDPRLGELLNEIAEKQSSLLLVSTPSAPEPQAPVAGPEPASWTTPTGDPGKDYVYQPRAPLPEAPPKADQKSATPVFSATSVTGSPVQPVPPAAPPRERTSPSEPGNSKRLQQMHSPPEQFHSTRIMRPVRPTSELISNPPGLRAEIEDQALARPASIPSPADVVREHAPKSRKGLISNGLGISAVLALTIGFAAYLKHHTEPHPRAGTQPQLSQEQHQGAPYQQPQRKANAQRQEPPPTAHQQAQPAQPLQLPSTTRYAPVLSDTEEYIAQGRWDEADARLNGLPTTLPEYGELKAQIAAGRREDNDFNSRKTAVDRAEYPKNEQELRTLLDYFNGVAGQRGRHSSEAQELVARIERDLNPAPPNYEPTINAAQGFVAQFRWDDAERALSGLPTSLPEYSQLKSQIDAGRSEDSDFNSRKSEIDPAEKAKNEAALRTLLSYFNRVVNQGGRHSGEARGLVPGINRTISEIVSGRQPPPTSPNPPTIPASSRDDAADIISALNQYAAAIKDANMDAVRLTRQFRNTDDENKFANGIKAMRGQGYTLRNCTSPAIAGDMAKVSCDVALLANRDVKPARTTLTFNRVNSHWVIVATN